MPMTEVTNITKEGSKRQLVCSGFAELLNVLPRGDNNTTALRRWETMGIPILLQRVSLKEKKPLPRVNLRIMLSEYIWCSDKEVQTTDPVKVDSEG
ncbi:hypothetical protein EPUS_02208 [Endocarpon pusillum Z07020]|uniref:Uncharacterized protein n=1 Tax=Endocarpon pusillum (strain Z07020 / HMAS-L-300199) TaxID=1263415 RepID=U1I3Q3_ENDPU|nr:uncharacterized protein EPUS_02208 [Endocarpon pusillum Z07020]ERF76669.1 hypothetical protein EPUS_02208 [Endocarpon pusillum Z07020]